MNAPTMPIAMCNQCPLNDLPGKPTGYQANKQNHKKCLPRHSPLPLSNSHAVSFI